jgi:hypothetical protein
MVIDETAPVVARGSIDIEAEPERVWALMSSIEGWPSWNPDVKWARLDGDLAAGSGFQWKAGPGTIRSTIAHVDEPSQLAWTGSTLGIHAVHVWRIEPAATGAKVLTEESWRGLLPRLLRSAMTRSLQTSIDRGLEALKAAAEDASA